jgi:hypothetical protein
MSVKLSDGLGYGPVLEASTSNGRDPTIGGTVFPGGQQSSSKHAESSKAIIIPPMYLFLGTVLEFVAQASKYDLTQNVLKTRASIGNRYRKCTDEI